MLRPEGMGSVGSDAVPFLVDTSSGAFLIDHLKIEAMPASSARRDAGGGVDPGDVADHVELARGRSGVRLCQTDYKTSWARTSGWRALRGA